MPRARRGEGKAGLTRPVQFRLAGETLAALDEIAAYHTAETGVNFTRADAVRLAAKREADRIRRAKKGGKK
jgi:hypothetical protein